ncbi:MAG: PLP-dependent transferase, partial [Rothia mucilaginosa]|nr:PLP-dependent transferase [Rothia mucilaginosa]
MSADNHDMNYSAETYVVAGGRPAHEHDAPVNPPIVLTSTYRGVDAVNIEHDRVYARFSNPTWEGMEEVVAKLENASQPGLLFPSGMAAVSSVIDLVPVGAIVLIPKHAYMSSVTLCKDLERRGIIELVRVDIEETASVIAALED